MKKTIAIIVVLIAVVATIWYTNSAEAESRLEYRFVSVETGDLESVVASTGNLNAVTTVQVGTQVSGIVNRIYVDFNDKVYRGQIIARIDTTLLVSSVRDARATMTRNQAQLDFSRTEYDRIKGLFDKQFATEVELNQAKYNLDLAEATIVSTQISLERAQRNLDYATIVSPINGVVVERNVDEGQTVAASLNTPQLFLIANDLASMEILASVDESDIGLIEEGQEVRFTVQAYDEAMFAGTVRQVRLQSSIQENVVTYTAVIDVDNSDGKLLPGMTATVEFLIDQASDVMKVPNAALRFRPNEQMMTEMIAQREAQQKSTESSSGEQRPSGGFGRPTGGRGGFGGGASDAVMLWYLNENGDIQVARARTGITDGSMTEVIGASLEAGMQVISGVSVTESEGGFKNPFQSKNDRGSRFSRGGGF
ncbi:MAG: efflux RND transporter periplasmic adaptor subunit [Bacteroidetes Order II. Incertae sedis bacterium]|jgi:HlyD family secretion protein|nr:efflux RND transporter periplasmic adaptor subunit [Bacteroidetes Order II. bacterium]MBT5249002.1 efflux RND transporter periplasmic adaptor subunit [Bacteroidetes Order II. bacterium]MBT6201079.1 efflux RND transporter periplasmic adaptor subunit [Bacteroidetes Order II. bacterium]MBT6425715.1 efflux RND transporter periplasmic adaptor subunit [Bacteroidetes Order II. bacterium]MBT6582539.1 efflux RND transporter periplasmic adaptor subunit [Bacteroidetes Order II. bacterium]